MNVLLIYPYFDIEISEMAKAWLYLVDKTSNINLFVVSGTKSKLKACKKNMQDEYERVKIIRQDKITKELLINIIDFNPNVIFCAVSKNLNKVKDIKKRLSCPVILHNEFFFFYEGSKPLVKIPLIRNILCLFRSLLYKYQIDKYKYVDRVLISDSKSYIYKKQIQKFSYLPWPFFSASSYGEITRSIRRNNNTISYIGSLLVKKHALQLLDYFKYLAENSSIEINIIGQVFEKSVKKKLFELLKSNPHQIIYKKKVNKESASRIINESLCVLAPGKQLGWGLINEAWSMGTPVVCCYEHYTLKNNYNCLKVNNKTEFINTVNTLIINDDLYRRLVINSWNHVNKEHCHANVSKILLNNLTKVVRNSHE